MVPGLGRIGEGLPHLGDRPDQHAAGVGFGVVHLAPLGDDLRDPGGHPIGVAAGALADVPVGGGVEAEALDRDLELVGVDRPGGVQAVGLLGQRARGREHAVDAQLLGDLVRL